MQRIMKNISFFVKKFKKSKKFDEKSDFTMLEGDVLNNIKNIPDKSVKLLITSPPYNLGKEYEEKQTLKDYLDNITPHLKEFERVIRDDGSLCWQVGNFVEKSEVFPLDIFYYEKFITDNKYFIVNRFTIYRKNVQFFIIQIILVNDYANTF